MHCRVFDANDVGEVVADAGGRHLGLEGEGHSEEEVMAKVEEHAKKAHNVQMPTGTIRNYPAQHHPQS